MEDILSVQFSWGYLLSSIVLLLGLFFALQFIDRLLTRVVVMGSWMQPVHRVIRFLILVFEPLAVIWVGGIFVLINPVFHGLLLALLFLSGFTHLRNYIAGRVIQMDHHIERGARLRAGQVEGVVLEISRLGVELQTKEGLYKLSYGKLLDSGYTVIAGDEIGGFYHLQIRPKDKDSKVRHLQHLQHLFVTTPYLDWSHKPEITAHDERDQQLEARVLVREENHLHDLMALIREWGYECHLNEA
ncbi:hypothetical protein [Flavilitoribacter nigricans]|uniref:Mechanosensitive ion channel n=1 Tax=Flavilitoribacter nigricans (strain ATCC 23147 / DSM 23189 / NBRC 102662 / NCIMB 1420 / SS-2) TaxID=1122177 RepID=A0A2D0NBL0_FLAN2|nr:hypothetical protein [Flavilitoribacter nigricans]PHN05892.1 hypothetical protein CRP01_12990 [Flavilitoribacter nigricans DSM 23189 = NBRC 102662]